MAEGFRIAEGYLDIDADPSDAMRNVQDFLRRVDQRLHRAEDDAAASGRRSGRRFGDGLNEGLRGAGGGNFLNDLIFGGGGGGGGEGGGGGGGGGGGIGGFIRGLMNTLSGGFRNIIEDIRSLVQEMEDILSGLGGGGGFLSDLREAFSNFIENMRHRFNSVIHWLQGTWTRLFGSITSLGVGPFFSGLLARARAFWTRFSTWASSTFGAMTARIRGWWGGMMASLSSFWTRFATWAIVTFGGLRYYANVFWRSFRGWATSAFASMSLLARMLWSRMRGWASTAFSSIRGWFSRMWSNAHTRGRSLWTRFAGWASRAFASIGGWFTNLWSSISAGASAAWTQLSSIFSQLGSVAGQLGPVLQVAGYAALVPVILALGGAIGNLLPLLLLLPAAIGTLVSIIAPAIVAFKGFGEAVGAGMSGDLKKFNDALKKLTPNARAVAKEIVALGPAFKSIKSWTQNALFLPLIGTIKPLATTLLPALQQGMAKAASGLGRLLAGFARMLATPEVISAINTLFATTERILDRLGPPLASLFGALFGTMESGLPWIERFVDVIADGIQNFADWLREIKSSGQFTKWMETAWSTAKDLWAVVVQLGLVVKNLFSDTGDEGQSFLQGIASALKDINKWLTSREGKDFIDVLASSVVALVAIFKGLSWVIGTTIGMLIDLKNAGIQVWGWLKSAWSWLSNAFSAVIDWIVMASKISWDWLKNAGSAIAEFFGGIGRWFADAYNAVVGWISALGAWIAKIPGWIGQFFSNLPGWIESGLAALRDAVAYSIGYVAGLIVRTFMDMPGAAATAWAAIKNAVVNGASATWNYITGWVSSVGASLRQMGSDMVNAVTNAWNGMFESTSRGVQRTANTVSELPGKASNALSSLPGTVGNWVSSTWSRAVDSTSRGLSSVVSTVSSLGGRIVGALSGAGSWLVSAGANMMRGLGNGIMGMLGWAVDQAYAAARKVKEGFLSALGIRSPSRVMRVEVGRQLLPGAMEGVKDTIPDAQRYMGAVANMLVQGFTPTVNVAAPSVHTGDVMLQADFGEGIRQAVPLIITRNPRIVAGAAAVGDRQRSGWVNTARGTVR